MSILQNRLRTVPAGLPRIALTAILIAAALAAGYGLSVVRATHTDPSVIHLCVNNYTTQVRYVTNPAQCSGGFVIDVNQQGVPGAPGQDGVSGYEIVEVTVSADGVNAVPGLTATASCPAGKQALGGGVRADLISFGHGWAVIENRPDVGGAGWVGLIGDVLSLHTDGSIIVWAICAEVAP